MSKKKYLLGIFCMTSVMASAQFVPVTRNVEIANSPNFSENEGGIQGYVRASAYGFGQDGGESGSENYDLATSFAEAAVRANFKRGYDGGYFIIAAEARLRHGQYFNGKLDGTTNTNDMYKTDLELRDLYVGYRRRKWEVIFGNQNIQWGRGVGSNPTNNLSPSNLFFLSANAEDKKMYNLMLNVDYQINPGLDLQVVGIPHVKSSDLPVSLFNLGTLVMEGHENPEAKIKNGAVAARLNWNNGPMGASISYFNGYDPFPTMNAGFNETGGVVAKTLNCRKQTIGADFGIRIPGKQRGGNFVPTNDWMIMGEVGYNIYKSVDGAAYVPQDNLGFSLGLTKMIYAPNNVDCFTGVISWYGKYTPKFKKLVDVDPTADPMTFLDNTNVRLGRFFNGQQKSLDHAMMLVLTQSFCRNKVSATLMGSCGINEALDFSDAPSGHNITISPRVNFNFSKQFSLTAGGMRMWGGSADAYGPVMGGVFAELKAMF